MPSHAVEELLELKGSTARARLVCGCELTVEVPADRVLEVGGGKRILVGKYPCPNGHPVSRPRKDDGRAP